VLFRSSTPSTAHLRMPCRQRAPTTPAHLHPALAATATGLIACNCCTGLPPEAPGQAKPLFPHGISHGGRCKEVATLLATALVPALQLRREHRVGLFYHKLGGPCAACGRCVFTKAWLAARACTAACSERTKISHLAPRPASTLQVPAPARWLTKQNRKEQRYALTAACTLPCGAARQARKGRAADSSS